MMTHGGRYCPSFSVTSEGPGLPWKGLPMGNGLSGARAEHGAVERARELDEEHRRTLRGALPLTLSLRYLATALGRLRAGTQVVPALPIARPAPGIASLTFVGHATVMLTT